MTNDELARATEPGVEELGIAFPDARRLYELHLPRRAPERGGPIQSLDDHVAFLRTVVFPLVERLEREGDVRYWHVLVHADLDIRLLIEDDDQRARIDAVLAASDVEHKPLEPWTVYRDPGLGSRLGCQSILRLLQAQSIFLRETVQSAEWARTHISEPELAQLLHGLLVYVPFYMNHLMLNAAHANGLMEVQLCLSDAHQRLASLIGGAPGNPATEVVSMLQAAEQRLQELIAPAPSDS